METARTSSWKMKNPLKGKNRVQTAHEVQTFTAMCKHHPMKIINGNAVHGNLFTLTIYSYYARRKRKNARQMFFPVGEIVKGTDVN